MTRKRERHIMLEVARQLYLQQYGTLKGFGKIAINYNSDKRWRDGNSCFSVGSIMGVGISAK